MDDMFHNFNYMTFIWMICFIIQVIQLVNLWKNSRIAYIKPPKSGSLGRTWISFHDMSTMFTLEFHVYFNCSASYFWSVNSSVLLGYKHVSSCQGGYTSFVFCDGFKCFPLLSESILLKNLWGLQKWFPTKLPVKNRVDALWLEFVQHSLLVAPRPPTILSISLGQSLDTSEFAYLYKKKCSSCWLIWAMVNTHMSLLYLKMFINLILVEYCHPHCKDSHC